MKPTITEQQARDRVEKYIDDTLAVFPASTTKKLDRANRSECTDPTDNGPGGRFEISSTYQLVGLDPASYPNLFDTIVQWWKTHGFTVLHDSRPTDQYVFARNDTDAFDMSLQANDLGKIYLGATSPCVWPNGTPPADALGYPDEGSEQVSATPATELSPAPRPRKPRRPPVDDEDFAQTDWADEDTY